VVVSKPSSITSCSVTCSRRTVRVPGGRRLCLRCVNSLTTLVVTRFLAPPRPSSYALPHVNRWLQLHDRGSTVQLGAVARVTSPRPANDACLAPHPPPALRTIARCLDSLIPRWYSGLVRILGPAAKAVRKSRRPDSFDASLAQTATRVHGVMLGELRRPSPLLVDGLGVHGKLAGERTSRVVVKRSFANPAPTEPFPDLRAQHPGPASRILPSVGGVWSTPL